MRNKVRMPKDIPVPEIQVGRAPLRPPFEKKKDQQLLTLAQIPGELAEDAIERAKTKQWWPLVIDDSPRLFRGRWTWLANKM